MYPINIGMVFETLLTSREAARLAYLHCKTLERMARSGLVPSTKQGRCWLFRASKLNLWINDALDLNTSNRSKTAVRNDGIRPPEHVLTSGEIPASLMEVEMTSTVKQFPNCSTATGQIIPIH
jgi:excisionase family DNA binding protein